jgi:hypothetical protein
MPERLKDLRPRSPPQVKVLLSQFILPEAQRCTPRITVVTRGRRCHPRPMEISQHEEGLVNGRNQHAIRCGYWLLGHTKASTSTRLWVDTGF